MCLSLCATCLKTAILHTHYRYQSYEDDGLINIYTVRKLRPTWQGYGGPNKCHPLDNRLYVQQTDDCHATTTTAPSCVCYQGEPRTYVASFTPTPYIVGMLFEILISKNLNSPWTIHINSCVCSFFKHGLIIRSYALLFLLQTRIYIFCNFCCEYWHSWWQVGSQFTFV